MTTLSNIGSIKLVECPRDAMQGVLDFIPTTLKIEYMNTLLKVGFHTLDCGSFVSPKIIPQMRDTAEVLDHLDLINTSTQLSVIVANERGAKEAVTFDQIDFLGYPFSISNTFQLRNTNTSMDDSVNTVRSILELCHSNDKNLVLYISMGFGNPYGDEWNAAIVSDWIGKLSNLGVKFFSISDTVGISNQESIQKVFALITKYYTHLDIGAHFHTTTEDWLIKVETAYQNGCVKFDGALRGFGGCPMAKDDLVGNMPTENMVNYFGIDQLGLDPIVFQDAILQADHLFKSYL